MKSEGKTEGKEEDKWVGEEGRGEKNDREERESLFNTAQLRTGWKSERDPTVIIQKCLCCWWLQEPVLPLHLSPINCLPVLLLPHLFPISLSSVSEGVHPRPLTFSLICQRPGRRQEVTPTRVAEKRDAAASLKGQNSSKKFILQQICFGAFFKY